ncbi:hypothetical protein ACHAXT_008612 [Thalassiosira profunda]
MARPPRCSLPSMHVFGVFLALLALKPSWAWQTPLRPSLGRPRPRVHLHSSSPRQGDGSWDLSVAIVGAGPSGLLLAHRLAKSSLPINFDKVDVYESRSDPRDVQKQNLGSRAYALGLGIRGRTAIKAVDEEMWEAVKKRGYECERFRLHFNAKWNIKLRDRESGVEPSVLIYQTDLCGALLDELDKHASSGKGNDAIQQQIEGPYDLIVGCDGANSIVRDALQAYSPPNTFSFAQRKLLPGCFKVARTEKMPPLLDPESVGLILPETKSLGITAFVEPTVDGGSCILFAGRLASSDKEVSADKDGEEMELGHILFPPPDAAVDSKPTLDAATISKLIIDQFPLLEGTPGMEDIVKKLLSQRTSVAQSVKCNIYSSSDDVTATAICGDAAHATGGVSGQGCNSALMDSVALANSLEQCYRPSDESGDAAKKAKRDMLHQSVSSYSQKALPEGQALYDLSFGNDGMTLPIFRSVRAMLSNAVDALFGGRFGIGKKPLQTLLASSSAPFVEIRRDREKYYVKDFPSDEMFRKDIDGLYGGSRR